MSVDVINNDIISLKQDSQLLHSVFADMLNYAKEIVVKDDDSFRDASSVWRRARDWKKQVESQRKAAGEPYRKQLAMIADKAKELSQPLEQVEMIIERKNLDYQNVLIAAKVEEERRIREAAELLDIAEVHVDQAPVKMRTEDATTFTVTKKRFRVKDINLVPLQYLTISSELVEAAMKAGINEIPGLEIWSEEITKMRSR